MNRDFWRGALSVALVLGTLSFLESVGAEPLPGWVRSPRDLDLPAGERPVDKPRSIARQEEEEIPMVPEPPDPPRLPEISMADEECSGDCQEFEAGFAWAAVRAVSDARQCPDRGDQFVDGCKSWVRHMRGEEEDSDDDDSDDDDSDDDSGDHNRR